MLKLTASKQNSHLQSFYGTRIRKISTRIRKIFGADPDLFYTKRADPKPRIGTKHETVPENVKRMFITSWYSTVPQ